MTMVLSHPPQEGLLPTELLSSPDWIFCCMGRNLNVFIVYSVHCVNLCGHRFFSAVCKYLDSDTFFVVFALYSSKQTFEIKQHL